MDYLNDFRSPSAKRPLGRAQVQRMDDRIAVEAVKAAPSSFCMGEREIMAAFGSGRPTLHMSVMIMLFEKDERHLLKKTVFQK